MVDADGLCFDGIRGLQVDSGAENELECGDGGQEKAKTPIDRSEWADR